MFLNAFLNVQIENAPYVYFRYIFDLMTLNMRHMVLSALG